MFEVRFKVPVDTVQVAFSPDGRYLVCGGHIRNLGVGNVVSVIDIQKRRKAFTFKVNFKKETMIDAFGINGAAFSPDGKTLALGSFDGSVLIWDWEKHEQRLCLYGHNERVTDVAFSPSGQFVATSAYDYRVKLWNPISGRIMASFKATSQDVECVAISPDSKRIAWGTHGGRLTSVEVESRRESFSFRLNRSTVKSLAYSPCGRFLAAGGDYIQLMEADTAREILTLNDGGSFALAFSPDGRLLASASVNDVFVWDLEKKTCACTMAVDKFWRWSVCFSPDGKLLAAGGLGTVVGLWDVAQVLARNDRSRLTNKTGTVTLPSDQRTGIERQAAEAAATVARTTVRGIKGMPMPDHLANCTARVQSKCTRQRCVGRLQCQCGHQVVRLSFVGATFERNGKTRIKVAEIDGAFFLIVRALCVKCRMEHLLFDRDFHGWNGFVCRNANALRPRPLSLPWCCAVCGTLEHRGTITVAGEGKMDALAEGLLDETNWQEGFGWIDISLSCIRCGHKTPGWVDFETM